jgi:hypothetical protein
VESTPHCHIINNPHTKVRELLFTLNGVEAICKKAIGGTIWLFAGSGFPARLGTSSQRVVQTISLQQPGYSGGTSIVKAIDLLTRFWELPDAPHLPLRLKI